MSLSRILVLLLVLVGITAIADFGWVTYKDLRAHITAQTVVVQTAVEQINEIATNSFTKSIAQAYYRQAQLDMFIEQTFGSQVARTFKQQEGIFMRECAPTFGELVCRQQWYKAQTEEIDRRFQKRHREPETYRV